MEITIFLELLFISAVRQKSRKEQCLIQDLSKFNFEYEFTWFFDQSSFFFILTQWKLWKGLYPKSRWIFPTSKLVLCLWTETIERSMESTTNGFRYAINFQDFCNSNTLDTRHAPSRKEWLKSHKNHCDFMCLTRMIYHAFEVNECLEHSPS